MECKKEELKRDRRKTRGLRLEREGMSEKRKEMLHFT